MKAGKKKVSLHTTFHVGSGMKNVWIRIREEKMFGSEIKHPGSATLLCTNRMQCGFVSLKIIVYLRSKNVCHFGPFAVVCLCDCFLLLFSILPILLTTRGAILKNAFDLKKNTIRGDALLYVPVSLLVISTGKDSLNSFRK
jgi:hypothetical protein